MSLKIKPASECFYDQLSLGEVMLRLDTGDKGEPCATVMFPEED